MEDVINGISNNRKFISVICGMDDLVSSKLEGNDDGPGNDVSTYVFLVWPHGLAFANFSGNQAVVLDGIFEKEKQIK